MKVTTWNIMHFDTLIKGNTAKAIKRRKAVKEEIEELDPDVLCIVEAPGDLPLLRGWVDSDEGLDGEYTVATIPGTDDALQGEPNARKALAKMYGMQGTDTTGHQWIWFLVKNDLLQEWDAEVLSPAVWQDLTRQKKWRVHQWGQINAKAHSHWRHPQVLRLTRGTVEIEMIGVHLKSKINKNKALDANGDLLPTYVDEAMEARMKLATEAYDVRRYVERRFDQTPDPLIFVMGDMNDGPGRGHFEREYFFFDLVSNVQGDVFFARRFLNHALFDFDDHLRYSTEFYDKVEEWSRTLPGADALPSEPVDPVRRQLIDHILFTQGLVDQTKLPRVEPKAGLVEHTVHQRVNATLRSDEKTSDHTPVSLTVRLD